MIRGKNGGAGIEAALPYLARLLRPPPPRALPKIRIPRDPRVAEQLVRRKISTTLAFGPLPAKFTRQNQEWIKATEKEVGVVTSVH